jgi:predicted permease
MNGKATTIIGVLPAGFSFPDNQEMWTPLVHKMDSKQRGSHGLAGYARLRPGATLDEARTEAAMIADRLSREYKSTNEGKTLTVRLLRDEAVSDTATLMNLMLGAAVFVLLIACANVANLLLAKAAGRAHEIAIRVSVGATRGRIARQVLTESLLLGLLGGGFGLLVATWADGLLFGAIPDAEIPFWMTFGFDWRVFAFAVGAAVISALVFGVFPALQASRSTALELRDGARSVAGGRRSHRLRQGLVVAQVALSAVLLIGAGLFIRSFLKLQSTSPGYDAAGVLTFRVGLPPSQFTDKDEVNQFFDQLTPRLAQVPGVVAAGATAILPGQGNNSNTFVLEGEPAPKTIAAANQTTSLVVSPGYLQAMRIPLLRGRPFGPGDTRESPFVVLVDQQFVDRWCGGKDPIGRRLHFGLDEKDPKWATIIGVVGNAPLRIDQPYLRGGVYNLVQQNTSNFLSYAVRVSGDPATYGPALQKAVLAVKPGIPIYNVNTMAALQRQDQWERRFFGQVFGAVGLGAHFLSALGVYGVMAYSVSQRTSEIGVRMALGASPRDVVGLINRQGFKLVGLGLVIGVVAALGLTQFMAALLFGISPSDPPTYFALTTVLAAVGLIACWLPARRATRVNPLDALRAQ